MSTTQSGYSSRASNEDNLLFLSAAQIRALSDDELLERWDEIFAACLNEQDPSRLGRLRQSIDAINNETSGKRKLVNWTL